MPNPKFQPLEFHKRSMGPSFNAHQTQSITLKLAKAKSNANGMLKKIPKVRIFRLSYLRNTALLQKTVIKMNVTAGGNRLKLWCGLVMPTKQITLYNRSSTAGKSKTLMTVAIRKWRPEDKLFIINSFSLTIDYADFFSAIPSKLFVEDIFISL